MIRQISINVICLIENIVGSLHQFAKYLKQRKKHWRPFYFIKVRGII